MKLPEITKQTSISISLAIVFFGWGIRNETRVNTLENQVKYHLLDPTIHHAGFVETRGMILQQEEKFMREDEAMIHLSFIKEAIQRIEEKLK